MADKRNNAIWVAIISGAAIVIAALIAAYVKIDGGNENTSPGPSLTPDISYAGRVIDAKTKALIKDATVYIDTRGGTQKYNTDDNGIYKVSLSPSVESVKIRVEANGYTVKTYNVTPSSRDQLEDIRLEYPMDSSTVNLPEGMTLKNAIEFAASQDDFGTVYVGNCDTRLMRTQVQSGKYRGKDMGEIIDQLKHRLTNPPPKASYNVTKIAERKVYQVECTN